jgi:signal transduction histidine kinase/ligand-binding sensor domain-containing protein
MRSFFLLTFFGFITRCLAQVPVAGNPLVLSNISEQTGLSDDHVQCVYKDKEGFVWIGTSDGLNLMDGSRIRIFRHLKNDSSSLPSGNILSLAEDHTGTLYIGTTGGLSWYDSKKKKFSSAAPPQSPYGVSADIERMFIADNNKIWCATDGGLFLFEKNKEKFTPFYNTSIEEGTEIKYSNKLTCMTGSSDGRLWMSSNDGLWSFNTLSGVYKKIIHKNNDPYYHPLCMYVYEDREKNIWAGFWNTGLRKYDTHTGTLTDYGGKLDHGYTISCINEIKQPDGNFIIWLNGSLLAFDEKKNSYFNFQQPLSEKKIPAINPVYQSADGWVWLSSDKGLYIYNPQRQLFNHLIFKSSITSQGVNFYNYKNGLLVGAEDRDFLKWNDKNGKLLQDYSSADNNSTLLCLRQDKPDEFWIGTNHGILHTNLMTGDKTWYRHKEGDSTTIPRDFIASLLIDSKKNLWIFPWREGIWQMDRKTGQCKKLLDGFVQDIGKIKKLLVSDAAEDANGNIWMSDLDEGIILYNAKTKQFSKAFEKQFGGRYGVSGIFLRDRFAYSHLGDGLLKWNIDSTNAEKIALPAEMDKDITDMYPDKSGNWWMVSKNGLIVFNEKEKTFNRFTTADGLVQNDIDGTLFCRDDSTMIIGAATYFSFFKPELLIQSSISKKNSVVTEILVNNKNIDWDNKSPVSLGYRENNIVVRWALPDYGNPLRNQYYVKLKGIDEDWRSLGNAGEVQYANLSPGDYTIQLKAATANGVASLNEIALQLIIHPPMWKTWWFITIVSLILFSLFILVVRYISQRNLKERLLRLEKEQAVEKERNRISRDMHDDLGSGLTKIAIMSEVVKKQMNEPEKAKQQLENISISSRELVDNLQDIIWVLNPKNDTLENLAAYIREYALKFFEPSGTETQFNYPETFGNIKLSEETRRNLFLVIKESFNNIAKHAWCNKVIITIESIGSSVRMKVADDGKGFDMEKTRQFGNGLLNMRNRIEQTGGIYKIESLPGRGTITTIEIAV